MSDVFDATIARWLVDESDEAPSSVLQRALSAAQDIDQRRAWLFPRRWLPGALDDVVVRAPSLAFIGALVILVLLLVLMLSSLWAGSQDRIRNYLDNAADGLIAYSDGSSVNLVSVDGPGRRTVSRQTDVARNPVFSPDGQHLAYVAAATPGALGGDLVVVSTDGTDAISVNSGVAVTPGESANFAWSPDGSQLTFAGLVDGTSRIYVVDRDGTNLSAITDSSAQRDLPTWSSSGDWIAYRATGADGIHRAVEVVHPDGSEPFGLAATVASDSFLSRVQWAPHSDAAAYAQNVGFGSETKAMEDLWYGHVGDLGSVGDWPEAGVSWSPDGRFLTFLGKDSDVIVADYDRTLSIVSDTDKSAAYDGLVRHFGPLASCWLTWAPDSSALFGGSPGSCDHMVVIPINRPDKGVKLAASIVGPASWQAVQP